MEYSLLLLLLLLLWLLFIFLWPEFYLLQFSLNLNQFSVVEKMAGSFIFRSVRLKQDRMCVWIHSILACVCVCKCIVGIPTWFLFQFNSKPISILSIQYKQNTITSSVFKSIDVYFDSDSNTWFLILIVVAFSIFIFFQQTNKTTIERTVARKWTGNNWPARTGQHHFGTAVGG